MKQTHVDYHDHLVHPPPDVFRWHVTALVDRLDEVAERTVFHVRGDDALAR